MTDLELIELAIRRVAAKIPSSSVVWLLELADEIAGIAKEKREALGK